MAYAEKGEAVALARVDGWPIHLADLSSAVTSISERAAAGHTRGFTVFTLNLDHLVKLRRFPKFERAYRSADLVTADGAPVVLLARKWGTPAARRIERTTGADLFVPLAQAAAVKGLPIYLYGSTMDVLTRSADNLRRATRGRIKLAGLAAPSSSFDPEGAEADAAIEAIKASGARLVFVALGAPKQEVFAARAVARGCTAGFVCVGAAVDFVAGTQVRAPMLLQKSGLEWAWRLATNPRRLAGRYADCARLLLDVAIVTPLVGPFVSREF